MLALSKLLQLEPCIVLPYLDSVSSTVSFDPITTILPSRTSIKNHVQSVAARRPNPYAQPYVSHLVPQISKIEYLRFEYSMQYVGLYKRRNERIFWVSNLFCVELGRLESSCFPPSNSSLSIFPSTVVFTLALTVKYFPETSLQMSSLTSLSFFPIFFVRNHGY